MPETSRHASAATPESTVLDLSPQSHLDMLYRAALGPIRTDYYLPILSRFETYGRASPSWNWAACVCTLNWMLFRGMWLAALVYLGAVGAVVAVLATAIALTAPPMVASLRWSLWAALATLVLLIPGFFGNAWLYRVYRQRLDQALASTDRLQDACLLLARLSSTRQRLTAIVSINLAMCVLLAIGVWPSGKPMQMGPRTSGAIENLAQPASAAVAAAPVAEAVVPAAPTSAMPAPSADATPATTTAAAPVTHTSAPDRQGPFLINVGVFAQQENAQRVHTQLVAAGLPVISTALETGKGPRTRVRVGPFASRAQADAAAQQIHALQLDAFVIRQ